MLLFKYPLQNKAMQRIREEHEPALREQGLNQEEIQQRLMQVLMEEGVYDVEQDGDSFNLESLTAHDYTEDEIQQDMEAVDYDHAVIQIEQLEEEKERQAQLKELEHRRKREELEKQYQTNELELKNKREELEKQQQTREMELKREKEMIEKQQEEAKRQEELFQRKIIQKQQELEKELLKA